MAIINITDVTDGTITGNGSFDKLMESVNAHLIKEFDANRIKQTEYATVYLGALQTVLAQSMQFELAKQAADKNADLIVSNITNGDAQAAKDLLLTQAKIDLLTEQTESENKSNEVNGLIDLQKLDLQTKTLDTQSTTSVRDVQSTQDLLNKAESLLETTGKIALIASQTTSEDKNNVLNGVIDKQILEIEASTSLKTNQAATELNSSLDVVSTTTVRNAQSSQDLLNKAESLLETTAKRTLLDQKTTTETAQTVNSTGGTTMKQQDLFQAQTDGFARDSEQKLMKIYMDTYAVQRANDSGLAPPAKVDGPSTDLLVQDVLTKAGLPIV